MRVTENQIVRLASQATARARDRVATAQTQVATGVRVSKPSDDVAGWVEGRRAEARRRYLDGGETTIARSRDRLARTDQIFGGVGRILERARELAVQAGNDVVDAEDRGGMAVEVRALRDEALRLVNEQAPDGEHLLAGTNGTQAPFDETGAYVGDDVLRSVAADLGLVTVVGVAGTPLTAAAGTGVFATLEGFAAALEANDLAGIDAAIGDLATAGEQVAEARAPVGARIRALDSAQESIEQLHVVVAGRLADAVDADPVVAASRFTRELASLEAARAVATRVLSVLGG